MSDSASSNVEASAVAELLTLATREPAVLVVEGEAGIGKTTLLLDATVQARSRGFTVLAAHGSPAEVGYAYVAVGDLLAGVDDAALADLPERHRLALDRGRLGGGACGPGTDERTTAAAFISIMARLGGRAPVLLAIDDAQWLDPSSRAVIGFAARRLTAGTALLVTIRTGDPGMVEAPEWPTFPHPGTVTRIRLRPLSLGGVHALVAARWGRTLPRPVITRIHELSGGNPMFALELARAEIDTAAATFGTAPGLPDELVALVNRRLGCLDDGVQVVLLAAACAADPTVELVSRVVHLPPNEVVASLEALEALDVVTVDGHRIRFTHPLFATGIVAGAVPSRRRATHRALAQIVEQPESRARHLALASTSGDPATLAALDAASDGLAGRGALASAAELVELALGLGGNTPERRIRAAELHFRSGAVAPARAHLSSVLDEQPDRAVRALALAHLGAVKAYDDDLTGAIDALTAAAEDAGGAAVLRALCLTRLALAHGVAGRMADAVEYAWRAATLAEEIDAPALRSQALSLWVLSTFVQGGGVDRHALDEALRLEDPRSGATTFLRARAVEAVLSAYLGALDAAADQLRAVERNIIEDGTEVELVWVHNRIAAVAIWAGRYTEADDVARAAVQRAEQLDARMSLLTAWTKRAAAAAYRGRDADARADANAAIEAARANGAHRQVKGPLEVLAFLDVSRLDYTSALTVLRPLLADFDPPRELEIEGGQHLPDAIEALTALGHLDEAETLVDALLTHGADRARPWMQAVGARGRGMLLAARGDLPAAQRALEKAMTHHRDLPMPFEEARTLLFLGQLQRRRRQRGAARDTLTSALATFERLGATPWAARARNELGRLATPRGDGGQLTVAERGTADLAARGLSNRQIAAELFLSEKTVESNLSSVYRKLGIRSRAGLSAALDQDGPKGSSR